MKKIVHYSKLVRPGGGPAGYLYNLEVASCNSQRVEVRYEERLDSRIKPSNAKARKNNILKDLRRAFSDFKRIFKGRSLSTLKDVKGSVIIFHGVGEALLFLNHKDNVDSSNKYYLMMHSPVPPYIELASDTGNGIVKKIRTYLLRKIESRCLRKIDGLVVPNIHAIDNYYRDQPKLRALLESKDYKEIPTGIEAIDTTNFPSRNAILSSINVNPENIIVGYFGRFISDKGFDNFKTIVEGSDTSDITFISAGEGNLPLPQSANYINLGWRSDALEIINAVDYVLVPNNVAYFDLIILEALSMGKRVITTHVGGSKKLAPNTVKYLHFDSDMIIDFKKLIEEETWPNIDCTRDSYRKHYSKKSFIENYENSF
ncbi:glycosyltransferase [Vibrio caribbeanicus]|uniref:glycosyltransferase n=1 Tax=Vibrio caribbeanicus TaxID=701175 RepID=UPI0030DA004E